MARKRKKKILPQLSGTHLKPYILVAAMYLMLCVIALGLWPKFLLTDDLASSLLTFLGFASLALLNLFLLGKSVASLLQYVTDKDSQNKAARLIQLVFWTSSKLCCIILIAWALYSVHTLPQVTKLMALGLLCVVPIVGGYLWSLRQVQK